MINSIPNGEVEMLTPHLLNVLRSKDANKDKIRFMKFITHHKLKSIATVRDIKNCCADSVMTKFF